jgi:hypothetical protein
MPIAAVKEGADTGDITAQRKSDAHLGTVVHELREELRKFKEEMRQIQKAGEPD